MQIIENFRKSLINLGYGKTTCKMLPDCVSDFINYHNITTMETIDQQHIESFYNYLQERPRKRGDGALSESYIYQHIYALKTFFIHLEETGQIQYNPISAMKFKRPQHNARQPLTQSEVIELYMAAQSLKEIAVLHLFYSCGLRRSEAVALNVQDIHYKQQTLYVREGKGAKRRAVPLTNKIAHDLENYYLQERTDLPRTAKDENAYILNSRGVRTSGDTYNQIIKDIVKRAAIKSPCTPHYLRHSIATHLLENGLSIEYVRDFLGHSFLESTQIYAKVNKYQLRNL